MDQPPFNKELWQFFSSANYTELLSKASEYLISSGAIEILHIVGLALLCQKRGNLARPLLESASAMMPQIVNWHANSSIVSVQNELGELALLFANIGLESNPNAPMLWFSKGNALNLLSKPEEAIEAFEKAVELQPDMTDALLNTGNTYRKLSNYPKAQETYQKIIDIDPDNYKGKFNLASLKMSGGETVDNIRDICEDYLSKEYSPEVEFMLSMFDLADGNYDLGWQRYAKRWDCAVTAPDKKLFKKPILDTLEIDSSKHVIVSHEQGFGDSLQFVRYLPMLKEKINFSLLVPNTLTRIFKLAFPDTNIISNREIDHDFELPLMSCPTLFKTTLDTIPYGIYLRAEKPLQPVPRRVGLVWAGQRRPDPDLAAVDARRSMNLKDFEPFLDLPLEFVSLQIGEPASQIKDYPQIETPIQNNFDFLDTANVIVGLDLVITVDTAVAHVAAAMGVPTWVLSRHDACWRWLHNREDSPWYPTVRIFGQDKINDWTTPILSITENLKIRYDLK